MADNKSLKPVTGKLKEHFAFKLNALGKVDDSEKVYCVHCNKQLAYHGSNTSLTYHLQHKHPQQYERVLANEQKHRPTAVQKQNSVAQYVYQNEKAVSAKVDKDLTIAIAQWIASSCRPISIVEDPGLQMVLRIALQNTHYTLPSRRTVYRIISSIYYEELRKHKDTVEKCESLSITSDFWSSINNESYCSITGHWIDSEWNLMSVTLDCLRLIERHTAVNISGLYEDFTRDWRIAEKIQYIVADNALNMVASCGQTEYSHLPCVAHSLQLSILQGLKAEDTSPLIVKCRHLVRHLKHSSANTSELKTSYASICSKDEPPFHKLQHDLPARWNSTYLMLARLLEVKDAIQQFHIDYPKNYTGEKLLDTDWDKVGKYVSILNVLAEATQFLGAEQFVPCCCVLPLLAFLTKELRIHDDDPGYIAGFKTVTLNDLTTRVQGMNALPVLQMATALDPRFKKLKCFPKNKRDAVWKVVHDNFDVFCKSRRHSENTGEQHQLKDVDNREPAKKQRLTLVFTDSDSSDDESYTQARSGVSELSRYIEEDQILETEDPLKWWKLNHLRFPMLAAFAKTILCVPATSVPCERLFSSSGYILSKLRASLLPENVTMHVCLREWLR